MHPPKVLCKLNLSLLAAATLTVSSQALPQNSENFLTRLAAAHQVGIDQDVGGTLHIEPNDTPRAGEEVLAWVALTRKGGQTIPLADCDCTLSIYDGNAAPLPLLSPTLIPVDSEGYQGIPGANFTFPKVGAYTLVISGAPTAAADPFTPFELAFNVTVATGQAVPTLPADDSNALPAPTQQPAAESQREPSPALPLKGIALTGAALLAGGAAIGAKLNTRRP